MKTIDRILVLFCIVTISITGELYAQASSNMLENAIGSVVTVAVYETEEFGSNQLGFRGGEKPSVEAYERALNLSGSMGSGSGFVISYNGKKYIITNAHVVENASENAGSIKAFSVNRTKYDVRVLGGDSFYDIAVLEFLETPGQEITEVKFRDRVAAIGEQVYAIGNPLGEYPYSVSDGIVSAKNRIRDGITGKFGFLQTTATVIWGNSGGPLVDSSGEVIGINSQIAFANDPGGGSLWLSQINFALEGPLSKRLVSDIIDNNGRVDRAYFGIEITNELQYDPHTYIPESLSLTLTGVLPDAPSGRTLSNYIGATIQKVNGEPVRSAEEILYEFEQVRSNESVTITFEQNGYARDVEISSTALETEELESLGRYFFQSISGVTLNENKPGVQFSLIEDNVQHYKDGYYQEKKNTGGTISKDYIMLAAGLSSEHFERMWVMDDLYDLGAAIRLTGLQGLLDFYVTEQGAYGGEVSSFRKVFSDNEYGINKKLWY